MYYLIHHYLRERETALLSDRTTARTLWLERVKESQCAWDANVREHPVKEAVVKRDLKKKKKSELSDEFGECLM